MVTKIDLIDFGMDRFHICMYPQQLKRQDPTFCYYFFESEYLLMGFITEII